MNSSVRWSIAVLLGLAGQGAWASSLLHSSSETHEAPAVKAPRAVVELVLSKLDADQELTLAECLQHKGLRPYQHESLLVVSEVDLNGDGRNEYFVRPSPDQWCSVFYGAHTFNFWFIEAPPVGQTSGHKIVFSQGGDAVEVIESTTGGWHDIEVTLYTAAAYYRTTYRFVDGQYSKATCSFAEFDNGKAGPEKPCDF